MKALEVRVSDSGDIIYYKDRPHVLDNLSFVRDERHNCQLIVYATMSPAIPELHLTPSIIDDIVSQQNPDEHICHYCGCLTFDDTEIVIDGIAYCDDHCFVKSDD